MMDYFQLKLRNILHNTQYCGICLNIEDNNMSSIDEDIEIINIHHPTRTKALRVILGVIFNETENILASSSICCSCTEKVIQSYIFIENAKETSKIVNNFINEIHSKSDDIFNHISDCNENSNVVIVLENSIYGSSNKDMERKRTINDEDKNVVRVRNELDEMKKGIIPKTTGSKFKCVNCKIILPSHRAMKLHSCLYETNKLLHCKVCFKSFTNKQYLNAHYKDHAKIKCEVCHEIMSESELLDHLKSFHEDSLNRCSKCNKEFYSLKALQVHENICHETKEEYSQCLMCLNFFSDNQLRFHNCKYNCPECSETPCLHHNYLMYYKEQISQNAEKVRCLDCDYVCRRKEILLGHVNREHLNHHPFTCDKCGQQFYSKIVLTAHIHRFHRDSFICQFCDSEFSNIHNYINHVKSCEDIKRSFACEDCPASFDSSVRLTNHKKLRHSKEIFPCGLCNRKFLKEAKRKEHMVKVHSGLQIKNRIINVECVVCQERFDTKGELVQHMKSHDPNTSYPCRVCNKDYKTLRQFRAHNRKHNGPFATCHICGKEMREILIKKHLTTHLDSTETCQTCGMFFQNITLLKYHQKVHLESVPCPQCKKMINPAKLGRHWKGHLIDENPALRRGKKQQPNLKCEQCDYKTWNNTLLECHMNRHHLKIKPYVCHICSKDFIGKHLLKKHLETHDMKSVNCMVCSKSFANSACPKMHLRLHTGEKPYTCEICGDRFRSSSIMNVHKNILIREIFVRCAQISSIL